MTGTSNRYRDTETGTEGEGQRERDRGTSTDMGTVLEEGKGHWNRNSTIGTGGIVRDRR